jgi:hypothetical protein
MTRGIVNDLTGKIFGNLRVVGRGVGDGHGNAQWICDCGCGKQVTVRGAFLRKGQVFCSKQCELYRQKLVNDVTGQTFEKLTAVRHVGFASSRKAVWEFLCVCGETVVALLDNVQQGGRKSCGCNLRTAGGRSKSREYKNAHWHGYMMRKRRASVQRELCPIILSMYEQAQKLTEATGIPHEVDHVIPLQGRLVSGLHVKENLRVVTRHENRTKSRRFELDDVCRSNGK